MILLSVLTAPRKGVDYLPETLRQIDDNLRGSFGVQTIEKFVVTDGIETFDPPPADTMWWTDENWQRTGNRLAMWRVFKLAQQRGADWLIYCEDDLNIAPGLFERIANDIQAFEETRGAHGAAFVSYYDGRILPEGSRPGAYFLKAMPSESESFCGSLCLLIPRVTAEYLLTCDPIECRQFAGTFHGADVTLGYYIARSPWPNYAIEIPTLVDHRGDVSAVGARKTDRPIRGHNFGGVRDEAYRRMKAPFYAPKK